MLKQSIFQYIANAVMLVVIGVSTSAGFAHAEDGAKPAPFLPTWQLLNTEQKQQFVSGYLYGWREAARIADIVIGFVRENPDQAIRGLEKLRSVYTSSDDRPIAMVRGIDAFFADPKNAQADFAVALNAARVAG